MNIAEKPKIVLLGMMSKIPVAGNIWLVVQYLVGFRRLGYDVYYVEDSARWIYDPRLNDLSPDPTANLAAIVPTIEAHGFAGKWAFRTAGDLSFLLRRETSEQKRLSKAALETLAMIAYHQPITRAELEEMRGVSVRTMSVSCVSRRLCANRRPMTGRSTSNRNGQGCRRSWQAYPPTAGRSLQKRAGIISSSINRTWSSKPSWKWPGSTPVLLSIHDYPQ